MKKIKNINNAFDFTATLFLNDHQYDYYGGRFSIKNLNDSTFVSIEPKKSRLVVYTSGSENENQIEELRNGARYSLVVYFTLNKISAA